MSCYMPEDLDRKPVLKRLRKLYEPVLMKTENFKESSAKDSSNISTFDAAIIYESKRNMGSISYSWENNRDGKNSVPNENESVPFLEKCSPGQSPMESVSHNKIAEDSNISLTLTKEDCLHREGSVHTNETSKSSTTMKIEHDEDSFDLNSHTSDNSLSANDENLLPHSDLIVNNNTGTVTDFLPDLAVAEDNVDTTQGENEIVVDLSVNDATSQRSLSLSNANAPWLPEPLTCDFPISATSLPDRVLNNSDSDHESEVTLYGAKKLIRKRHVKKFQFPSETTSEILEGDLLNSMFDCDCGSAGEHEIEKSFEIMEDNDSADSWGNSERLNTSEEAEVDEESQENISLGMIRALGRIDSESTMDSLVGTLPPLQEMGRDMMGEELFHEIFMGGMLEEVQEAAAPSYPVGPESYAQCPICIQWEDTHLRTCCEEAFCEECMISYVTLKVSEGQIKIECPHTNCSKSIHRDEIFALLDVEHKEKFYRFLVNANLDPHMKTCPKCSDIFTIEPEKLAAVKKKKHGYGRKHSKKAPGLQVTCAECEFVWCFTCHAPWHEGISCSQFQHGDKLVKNWAREQHYGQFNAQSCPKCKIFINRSSGCDHMVCNQCNTEFCYRCGETFRSIKFIGNHYAKFSIFGCKYHYKPDQPHQRRFVRGSIFGLKILAAPIVAGLAVGALAVLAGVGIFALPIWGGIVLHKKVKLKKAAKQWKQHLEEMNDRDPYLEMFHRQRGLNIDSDHTATYLNSSISEQDEELHISHHESYMEEVSDIIVTTCVVHPENEEADKI